MQTNIELDQLESMVWGLFCRSVRDDKRGFHYLNVATKDDEGIPTVRTVILRKVSEEDYTLSFHTDARSRKFSHLLANPIFAMHAYDRKSNLQVAIKAKAFLQHMNKEAEHLYQSLHEGAKALYSKHPAPMTIIDHPGADQAATEGLDRGFNNFVWVDAKIQTMEILHLGRDMHRKMVISQTDELSKYWVVP